MSKDLFLKVSIVEMSKGAKDVLGGGIFEMSKKLFRKVRDSYCTGKNTSCCGVV